MLRKARKSDAEKLALIHLNELSFDFLPSLGLVFLTQLYKDFINNKSVEVVVFIYRNKVCGFIVGSEDFNRVFKEIIFKNFFSYFYLISKKLIAKPFIIKNVFGTLFYTNKEGAGPASELVVIAISNKFHRKGIGRRLICELEKKFKKKRITKYKVSVNKKNNNAKLFYRSVGFIKVREFSLYGKQVNLLIKNII